MYYRLFGTTPQLRLFWTMRVVSNEFYNFFERSLAPWVNDPHPLKRLFREPVLYFAGMAIYKVPFTLFSFFEGSHVCGFIRFRKEVSVARCTRHKERHE